MQFCNSYGSYEACIDPAFALDHLPLVDRGFTYAIAHIRGGGELGRLWHEDGKYLKKKNTFTDFIAAAEHLVALDYSRPELLCAEARARPPSWRLSAATCCIRSVKPQPLFLYLGTQARFVM